MKYFLRFSSCNWKLCGWRSRISYTAYRYVSKHRDIPEFPESGQDCGNGLFVHGLPRLPGYSSDLFCYVADIHSSVSKLLHVHWSCTLDHCFPVRAPCRTPSSPSRHPELILARCSQIFHEKVSDACATLAQPLSRTKRTGWLLEKHPWIDTLSGSISALQHSFNVSPVKLLFQIRLLESSCKLAGLQMCEQPVATSTTGKQSEKTGEVRCTTCS